MSGRQVFVVLARLLGILLLVQATQLIAVLGMLFITGPGRGDSQSGVWVALGIAVILDVGAGLLFAFGPEWLARRFRWDGASDVAVPAARNPWMRVAERFAGLIALVAALRSAAELLVPGIGPETFLIAKIAVLLATAGWLLARSHRRREPSLGKVFE